MWGVGGPMKLIQSWRAMKILEEVDTIKHETLSSCFEIADRKLNPYPGSMAAHAYERIAQGFGQPRVESIRSEALYTPATDQMQRKLVEIFFGLERVKELRDQVSKTAPSPEELDNMVNILRRNSLPILVHELIKEIDLGVVQPTPLLNILIQEHQVWMAQHTYTTSSPI